LLFLDASGLADLIDGMLLVAHELTVPLKLFSESLRSFIAFFDLSI
jgi:hypothetical protein